MFKCYNTLNKTLGNEYPSSNETNKKNGTVRGDCIACDALFFIHFVFYMYAPGTTKLLKEKCLFADFYQS